MSGPLPAFMAPLAWAGSVGYGAALRVREAWLERQGAWQAPRPVISVGNVAAGGTGKSPMVRWVCGQLLAMGRRPAIVTRGHRGGDMADEVVEHRFEMPDVPLAVGADRRTSIIRLLSRHAEVDALVLDDAFQHRRVARDLDLVLVDAMRPAIDGALLPLGWLREPAGALRRAGAVVVTRAHAPHDELAALVERHHGRPPAAWAEHAWEGLRVVEGGAESAQPVSWLRDRRVIVLAGIGHREAFVQQVKAQGARVAMVAEARDHQAYAPGHLARLAASGPAGADIVCTGKDWAKLRDQPTPPGVRVARPSLRVSVHHGEATLRGLIAEALGRGDSRAGR